MLPRLWPGQGWRPSTRLMPKKHLPAAELLAADALLTRRALEAAGLNRQLGARAAREGRGLRLAPSTYLLGLEPTDRQLVAAAREHAGDDAVVTGLLACRSLGLVDAPDDGRVEVLVPPGRRRVSTAHVRVQPTTRQPAYWLLGGSRVAEPHRAVVDGALRLRRLRDVRALVLEAVAARWCSVGGLRVELEARARNGTALCRRALRDAEEGAWSAPEAEVAEVAAAAVEHGSLPQFALNPTLLVDGIVVGQPDGWFLGLGLGWEVESRRHHAEDRSFDATLARHDRFAGFGLQLLHVTPRRARLLGSGYARVLEDAVAARRRAAQPEPVGLVVRPHDAVRRELRRPPGLIDRGAGPVSGAAWR